MIEIQMIQTLTQIKRLGKVHQYRLNVSAPQDLRQKQSPLTRGLLHNIHLITAMLP